MRTTAATLALLALLAGCTGEDAGEQEPAADAATDQEDPAGPADDDWEEALEAAYEEGYADGYDDARAELDAAEHDVADDDASAAEEPDAGEEGADLTDPEDADLVIRILEFFEPDEAEPLVAEANQFNDPPDEGHRFVMLLVEVDNRSEEPVSAFDLSWYAEGPENVVYSDLMGCGVLPDPSLDDVVQVNPGGAQQGHICFAMREADATATGERYFWAEESFGERSVGVISEVADEIVADEG